MHRQEARGPEEPLTPKLSRNEINRRRSTVIRRVESSRVVPGRWFMVSSGVLVLSILLSFLLVELLLPFLFLLFLSLRNVWLIGDPNLLLRAPSVAATTLATGSMVKI